VNIITWIVAVIGALIVVAQYVRTRRQITPLDFTQTPRRTESWRYADGPWPRNRGWHHKRTPTRRVTNAAGSQAQHRERRIGAQLRRDGVL
jgi:hypothetical protein